MAGAHGYGHVFAQIYPLGSQGASRGTEVKSQAPALMMPSAAALIAKAAMASEVPAWIAKSGEDL